jgi:uncharacterized membrane protein YbhN (UPF0104 family)
MKRLRGILKFVALAVVVAFIAWYVAKNWHDVVPIFRTLEWWQYVSAGAAIVVGLIASMLSWRSILAGMGSRLPMLAAARVFFLGQLGKYVPGSIWPVVAQAELASEYGTPRTRSGIALLVQMAVSTVVGTLFAALCLALSSPAAFVAYWWLLLIALVGVVCLVPPIFTRVMRLAARVLRRPADDLAALTWRALFAGAGWSLAMWAFFGIHLWVLAITLGGNSLTGLLTAAGGYALAWLVGFVIIFLPAGAGAREAALTLALAPVMSGPAALGLALVSRFLMLAADALFAVAAVAAERAHRRSRSRSPRA